AGARVAAGPRRAVLDGEGAKAAQLDPVAARHRRDDLAENGVDDVFHVALVEMRVLRRDALHELGLDHRCCRPRPDGANRPALNRELEGPKAPRAGQGGTAHPPAPRPTLPAAARTSPSPPRRGS